MAHCVTKAKGRAYREKVGTYASKQARLFQMGPQYTQCLVEAEQLIKGQLLSESASMPWPARNCVATLLLKV